VADAAARFLVETPPLYLTTFAIVAGDALGNLHILIPLWIAAAMGVAAAIAFTARMGAAGIALALAAIIAAATVPIGLLLAPAPTSASLTRFADDSMVLLEGSIAREPEHVEGGRTYLYVRAHRAGASGGPMTAASGLVRVTTIGSRHFRIGDYVRITARLWFPRNDGNPGQFDYRAWLMRQGIAAAMFAGEPKPHSPAAIAVLSHRDIFPASQIEAVREHIGAFIDANLPYPENAEMRALIIGDRGGIGEKLRQRFALTGMAHLLVISGLHLGFAAAAAFFAIRLLMGFFPALMALGYANKFAAVGAALAACAYASIAGHHVSTIRALVMVAAYAIAILTDRSRELLASLAIAALVICFAMPGSTADIGFQLSFASVAAIILGMRRFTAGWRWRHANPLAPPSRRSRLNLAAEWIIGYVAVSFWALIGTAPLTALHFNQVSLVGLAANVIVVPIMGFGAVICGLAAAAMSFVWIAPSRVLILTAGKLALTGTYLAGWFVRWPFAWTRIFTPTAVEIAITYGFAILWLTAPLKGEEIRRAIAARSADRAAIAADERTRKWRGFALIALLAASMLDAGWWTYQRCFNPDLRVTFLSVGEGDAAVVRFPGSRVMLIDGGGAFRGVFDPGERIVAPYLWAHKIMHVDYVTVSHPDRDHFGGLTFIVRNFSPSQFWTGGTSSVDESYGELLEAVRESGAQSRVCDSASEPMEIGGVSLRCVGPIAHAVETRENNASMVLRLVYGRTALLFAGDIEGKGERELLDSGADLRATILKVPHHGSETSSTPAFIEAVRPAAAVISLGYHNRFHFPSPDVVQRYKDDGVRVLRTDGDGAVSVDAASGAPRLSTFRGGEVPLPVLRTAGAVRIRTLKPGN
jgi:competence protein ComEC